MTRPRRPKLEVVANTLRGARENRPRGSDVLPEDCPVIPLGAEQDGCWYLDALGQLRFLKARDHSRNNLVHLFSPLTSYIEAHDAWCRFDKDGNKKGIRPEAVADALMRASATAGVWSPYAKVRGRGAWRGADGDLVLHLGRRLWIRGRMERCGLRGQHVYPVSAERPGPHPDQQRDGPDGPAAQLLARLRTWHWERQGLDEVLLLGWICAAMLGGALHWRPAIWITGDRGTGKSTLQELVKQLLVDGEGGYFGSDVSEAGIRQRVGYDSLPVCFDELEAEEDNQRVNKLIGLARQAASGGTILRGGSDHQGQDFIARFSVLYSSILVPPLRSQDLSRIAMLNLQPLRGGKPPLLRPDELAMLGQRLLRRVADTWELWEERLDIWREALLAVGYDSRGADQFGTLLAAADLALHDSPPHSDSIDELVGRLAQAATIERAEEMPDWQRCLQHITSSRADHWRNGEKLTFGTLIAIACNRRVMRPGAGDDSDAILPDQSDRALAQDVLASHGLRVELDRYPDGKLRPNPDGEWDGRLAVANAHAQLNGVFQGTHWAARSGAAGVWRQTLGRVPDAERGPAIWFRGVKQRTVLVPLRFVLQQQGAEQ
jgi:hypothetical protein